MKQAAIRLSDAAVSDIIEQAEWYEQYEGRPLAKRWENAVTSALLLITKNPRSGTLCSFQAQELHDVRRKPIRNFPKHLIFYRVEGDQVLILRVVHGARDLESLF